MAQHAALPAAGAIALDGSARLPEPATARLERGGRLHVEWRAPYASNPAEAILNAAKRWRAERCGVHRALLGSVPPCHARPSVPIATLTGAN